MNNTRARILSILLRHKEKKDIIMLTKTLTPRCSSFLLRRERNFVCFWMLKLKKGFAFGLQILVVYETHAGIVGLLIFISKLLLLLLTYLLGCDWRKWPCSASFLPSLACSFSRAVPEATHLPDNVSGMSVPCRSIARSYAPLCQSSNRQAGLRKEGGIIIIIVLLLLLLLLQQ